MQFLLLFVLLTAVLSGCCSTPPAPVGDLAPQLRNAGGQIPAVLVKPAEHRVQILISVVETNAAGKPTLHRSSYRLGAEYFYPASCVKLCGAVAALQEIERLAGENHAPDLLQVPLEIAPLFPGDSPQTADASNLAGGKITVGHEIRKITLVSDNQAFNRLFDLVGHDGINRRMHQLGLNSVVINHRLSESRTIPDPLTSAEVRFILPDREIVVPDRTSHWTLTNASTDRLIGKGYLQGEVRVSGPMDFTRRNGVALLDLQDLLVKVVRPDLGLLTPPLEMSKSHRDFLILGMSEFPQESKNPVYAADRFPDDCSKFLLPGIRRVFPEIQPGTRIQVTGKTGQAYGFTIENSYLQNPRNGRAVFVSAVIYANADGILNDDQYEYATLSEPFMADLGEWVARRWLVD